MPNSQSRPTSGLKFVYGSCITNHPLTINAHIHVHLCVHMHVLYTTDIFVYRIENLGKEMSPGKMKSGITLKAKIVYQ